MPMPRLERTYGCSMLLLWLVVALSRGQAAGADSGWNESNSSRIAACEPKSCGVGPNVSYPFWIHGVHPNYCGMRLFNVSCGGGFPVLPIWGENYTVYNISYDLQTVDLGKPVPEGNISCEAFPNRSFTFDRTPFVLSNSTNTRLLFFFDCNNLTRLPSSTFSWRTGSPGSLLRLPCHQEEGEAELGSFVRYSLWPQLPAVLDLEELMRVCPPVTLPVRPIPAAWDIIPDYNKLLDYRITLKWIAPDCTECRRSGGCCGTDFKETGYSFICICGDGDHRVSCDGKHKKTNWKIIGPAVAAPSALVVVLTLVLIFYRRRYKTKRSGSQSKLMRSASSESYSTEKDVEGLSSLTHKFTYGELEEATEGFKESNELGDGGFGTVYKGKLRDGRVVAVKRLYENNFKRAEQFINEVAILNRLRHKNLVSLYGCTSRHSRGLLLVYEYVPNGTVADHLHGPRVEEGALTWPVRMSIAIETAGALAYLHAVEPPIIHRDIKTNNILLDENFHVKVADFGLSRLFPPDATHVSTVPQGTPGYLDPEYHQCYQLTDKSDVYSFGVVLAELISSKPAVDISRKRNEINLANLAISRIQNCRLQELVDPLLGYDSDDVVRNMIGQVAELAFRCLQAEKEMRPSMEEVVEVLKGITGATGPGREHSRGKVERDVKKNTEDCSLLNDSVQYSPDTVHEQWVSTKTTPNTSGQASM